MKRILIAGNLGYIGPVLTRHLREHHDNLHISGLDLGFFADDYVRSGLIPEHQLDVQFYADVRTFNPTLLDNVDHVVYLAAISNDPMGNKYVKPTLDINWKAAVRLGKEAARRGVQSFVFASSCSVYGLAEDGDRNEFSLVNPLTPYAVSKVRAEEELRLLGREDFRVTSLRFATACGPSERLRLDLVLNDFVMSAIHNSCISILSDGTPWRPLIDVRDMARAIDWAMFRKGESSLLLNTGSNEWNYQIRDLAYAVRDVLGNVEVRINADAQPDNRSYRVRFNRFQELAPQAYPQISLEECIAGLAELVKDIKVKGDFRQSRFIRLQKLQSLMGVGAIGGDLELSARTNI